MDIKEILKEKIESAKKELEVAKTQSTSEAVCFQAKVDAYYDCLTLIEQSEKPMKVKLDDDMDTPFPVGHHICPKCGMDLELYVDGNDKDMWKEDCHFCPKCACPLDWGEGEK